MSGGQGRTSTPVQTGSYVLRLEVELLLLLPFIMEDDSHDSQPTNTKDNYTTVSQASRTTTRSIHIRKQN